MNLVDAALDMGFEAFVNAGSSSEYGFTDHPPTEDERAEPSSAYALTKLSQTLFCRFTAKKHDVHMPTLRLYSVYGPYEEPTRFVPRSLLTDSTDDFRSSPLRMSPAISFPSTTSRRHSSSPPSETTPSVAASTTWAPGPKRSYKTPSASPERRSRSQSSPNGRRCRIVHGIRPRGSRTLTRSNASSGGRRRFRSTRDFVVSPLGSARAASSIAPEHTSSLLRLAPRLRVT